MYDTRERYHQWDLDSDNTLGWWLSLAWLVRSLWDCLPALGHHRGHRQEDLSTFDREETLWSSLHNAGLEAGAQAGEPEIFFVGQLWKIEHQVLTCCETWCKGCRKVVHRLPPKHCRSRSRGRRDEDIILPGVVLPVDIWGFTECGIHWKPGSRPFEHQDTTCSNCELQQARPSCLEAPSSPRPPLPDLQDSLCASHEVGTARSCSPESPTPRYSSSAQWWSQPSVQVDETSEILRFAQSTAQLRRRPRRTRRTCATAAWHGWGSLETEILRSCLGLVPPSPASFYVSSNWNLQTLASAWWLSSWWARPAARWCASCATAALGPQRYRRSF